MAKISKLKKRKVLAIVGTVIIIILSFCLTFWFSIRQVENKYASEYERLTTENANNKRKVYVALKKIYAGSQITEQDIAITEVFSSMDISCFIDASDIGRIAAVDIDEGMPMLKIMLQSTLEKGLREEEYSCIQLMSNLVENDFVDVRIVYPNGENYSILSRKAVHNLSLENNTVFFHVNEEEIMRMSSAIVDTYIHPGTVLYVTRYIEDGQTATIPNYEPSKAVMLAMSNDPNIIQTAAKKLNLKAREKIESRLEIFESVKDVDLTTANKPNGGNQIIPETNTTVSTDGYLNTGANDVPEDGDYSGLD